MANLKSFTLAPGGSLKGELLPPGDKSISHRAVIFASLAKGTSQFDHFLNSEDCIRTLNAFQEMGVEASLDDKKLTVTGVGMNGLRKPAVDLYLGNSGTSTRLLLGILAAQPFDSSASGDESLQKRPMHRVVKPLREMGAEITGRDDGNYLPLKIFGKKLNGIRYTLPMASAQVKSCLLLAGLFADGETQVDEPVVSRDHTERALMGFGADYRKEGKIHMVTSKKSLTATSYRIPADISSAAFFIVGALIAEDSEICLKRVGLNQTRIGILGVLRRMGARIDIENVSDGPEPIGDLIVSSSKLKGVEIGKDEIPSLIDELPIITLAAALAEGETIISGAEELRVKESDRISVMVKNLKAVGACVEERPDGFKISGVERFSGGAIEVCGDHRIAMTFAIAALRSEGDIVIDDIGCVQTSYPDFFKDLANFKS